MKYLFIIFLFTVGGYLFFRGKDLVNLQNKIIKTGKPAYSEKKREIIIIIVSTAFILFGFYTLLKSIL
jgi:uncharacterized membrane protein